MLRLSLGSRRRLLLVAVGTGACALTVIAVCMALSAIHGGRFRVIYSLDKRENDKEVVRLINDADKYAYFAVYYFTNKDIADALVRAKERGLAVWGITDAAAATGTNKAVVDELRSAGIPVEVQRHQDGIMHMKVLVTDKAYASGSYNWTQAATEANDEVLEISTDSDVRRQYLAIVQKVLKANE